MPAILHPTVGSPRLPGVLLISLGLHSALMFGLHAPVDLPKPLLASLHAELRGVRQISSQPAATLPPSTLKALPTTPAQAIERKARVVHEQPLPRLRRNPALVAEAATPSLPLSSTAHAVQPAPAPAHAAVQSELAGLPVANAPAQEPARPSQGDLLENYRRQLAALLNRPRDYPPMAALRGWEGEVRLLVKIARKGSLLAVSLDRSSGFAVLDQHALAVLERQLDFPPLPERWEGSEIQVVVPIHYKLKKTT